jgi:cytoskeletal protein CcmA (bactofilin family)
MVTETYVDFKVVGTTSSAGGTFRHMKLTGEHMMNGDTICDSIKCMGEVEFRGSLTARRLSLTGECKIKGILEVDTARVTGDLTAQAIRGQELKITGHIKIEQNCEAEEIDISGWLELDGLINAERVTLGLYGPSRAKEVGGSLVTIKRGRFSSLKNLFSAFSGKAGLQTDLIEGDTLHLEYVRAAVVRGNHVTIGPGCEIGQLEYHGTLVKHPKSKIGSEAQI